MPDWADWEDSPPSTRTYGDSESAADLAIYQGLKRSVTLRTVVFAVILALIVLPWSPRAAIAVAAGGLCGVGNLYLSMLGNERLIDTGSVGAFVLSSFLRLALFGIVAAALAVWGPWWSFGPFFAGFFLPLALYAYAAPRAFAKK